MYFFYRICLLGIFLSSFSYTYSQRQIVTVPIADGLADCSLDFGVITPDKGVVLAGTENILINGEYKDIVSIRGLSEDGIQLWDYFPNLPAEDLVVNDIAGNAGGISILLTSSRKRNQRILRLNYQGQLQSETALPDQVEFSSSIVFKKGFDSNLDYDLVIGSPSRIALDSLAFYLYTSAGDLVNTLGFNRRLQRPEDIYIINNQTALFLYETGFTTISLPSLTVIDNYSYENFGVQPLFRFNAAKYRDGAYAILESNTSDSLFLCKINAVVGSFNKIGTLDRFSSFSKHIQLMEANSISLFRGVTNAIVDKYDTLGNFISTFTSADPNGFINTFIEGYPGAPNVAYSISSQSTEYGNLNYVNSIFSGSSESVCGFFDPSQGPPESFYEIAITEAGDYLLTTNSEDILKYDPSLGLTKILDLPDEGNSTNRLISLNDRGTRFGTFTKVSNFAEETIYRTINSQGNILIDTIISGFFNGVKPAYNTLNKQSILTTGARSDGIFYIYILDQDGRIISVSDDRNLPNILPLTERFELNDISYGPDGELALVSRIRDSSNNDKYELQVYSADRSATSGFTLDYRFDERITDIHFNSQGQLICRWLDRRAATFIRVYNRPLEDIEDYIDIQDLPNYTLIPVAFEAQNLLKIKLDSRGSQRRTGFGTLDIQTGEIIDSLTFTLPSGHAVKFGESFQNGYALGLENGLSFGSNVLAYLQGEPTNTNSPQQLSPTFSVQNPFFDEVRFKIDEEIKSAVLRDLLGRPIAPLKASSLGAQNYLAPIDVQLSVGPYILTVNGHSRLVIKSD